MAEPKGILFFLDDLDAMELLSDEEKGRLFTALLKYAKGEDELDLSGNERYLFPTFRSRIDRDRKKYQEKCEKNRENAKKRTHQEGAKPSESKPTQANASDGKPTQPIIKEKENEEEGKSKSEEKEEDKNISIISSQDSFEHGAEPTQDLLELGLYENVLLTPSDLEKLKGAFSGVDAAINRLSTSIFSGKTPKGMSHYNLLKEYLAICCMKGGAQ